ncbi:MAG: hypothetical protein OXF20_15175 [Gammaproteobacteria bacterium]|nr:hypothetical protein [Gammaproteobacteria bacterium]
MQKCMEAGRQHSALEDLWTAALTDPASLKCPNAMKDDMVKGVTDCLHRNARRTPLAAAFFSLSDAGEILSGRGLSRPLDEQAVNLELLDYEEACDVIRSMFKDYSFTGSSADQEIWLERLAGAVSRLVAAHQSHSRCRFLRHR